MNQLFAATRRRSAYAAAAVLIGLSTSIAAPLGASAVSLEAADSASVSADLETVAPESVLAFESLPAARAASAAELDDVSKTAAPDAETTGIIYPRPNALTDLADGPRRAGILLFTVLGLAFFGIAYWGRKKPEA